MCSSDLVRRLLIEDIERVQRTRGHELVAVNWVDSPPWVAGLPPGSYRLRLQLPHLLALPWRLLCHQRRLHRRLRAVLRLLLKQTCRETPPLPFSGRPMLDGRFAPAFERNGCGLWRNTCGCGSLYRLLSLNVPSRCNQRWQIKYRHMHSLT